MEDYIFEPVITAVPIEGAASFPVRRVFCVGRNYAEHAREMGHDPEAEPPFFFTKPADAVVNTPAFIPYPLATQDLHHEVELVVAIAFDGHSLTPEAAAHQIFGYAVGIDLTRRDLQAEAKRLSRPWDMAKGFDNSAPISKLQAASRVGHPTKGRISLKVNNGHRQVGDIAQMIWDVPHIISHLSHLVALRGGDLIFTGTPAGVGPVRRGESLEAEVEGIGLVHAHIGN